MDVTTVTTVTSKARTYVNRMGGKSVGDLWEVCGDLVTPVTTGDKNASPAQFYRFL
jgi:hypothetical protein